MAIDVNEALDEGLVAIGWACYGYETLHDEPMCIHRKLRQTKQQRRPLRQCDRIFGME